MMLIYGFQRMLMLNGGVALLALVVVFTKVAVVPNSNYWVAVAIITGVVLVQLLHFISIRLVGTRVTH